MSKVYFRWMGAYWSCSPEVWEALQARYPNTQDDLIEKCKELKSRPKGIIKRYRDNERRQSL